MRLIIKIGDEERVFELVDNQLVGQTSTGETVTIRIEDDKKKKEVTGGDTEKQ